MSCSQDSKRAAEANRRSGINRLAGQVGSRVGVMAGRLSRAANAATEAVGSRVSPVTNRVLKTVDRPTTVAARLAPALVAAACVGQARLYTGGPGRGTRPGLAVAVGMRDFQQAAQNLKTMGRVQARLRQAEMAGGVVGGLAARAAADTDDRRTLALARKRGRAVEVSFSPSRLGGPLNRRDRLVGAERVLSSRGQVVQAGGRAWHLGTSVVETGGQERTISHLRSLSLPSTSYYFDRALSDEETADLVTGQVGAHKLAGYVGGIDRAEGLAPAWTGAKRAMILARLHWPTPEKSAQTRWQGREEPN